MHTTRTSIKFLKYKFAAHTLHTQLFTYPSNTTTQLYNYTTTPSTQHSLNLLTSYTFLLLTSFHFRRQLLLAPAFYPFLTSQFPLFTPSTTFPSTTFPFYPLLLLLSNSNICQPLDFLRRILHASTSFKHNVALHALPFQRYNEVPPVNRRSLFLHYLCSRMPNARRRVHRFWCSPWKNLWNSHR